MVETNGAGSLEPVPGFNSYRARNAGLFPHTSVHAGPVKIKRPFELENVIGDDGRTPVEDTTKLPWRCIALLSITYRDGATAYGSAWFYSARTLGTAGHNIRHPEHGEAETILVSPGYDGANAPFGSYAAVSSYCDPAWMDAAADDALDFGILQLDGADVGRRLGWFGMGVYSNAQLLPLLVNVSGYPADLDPPTQYFNGGRLQDASDDFLEYEFDTEAGMSGAPIFALFGTQRVVVGIHTSGGERFNRARRVDATVFNVLNHFR